jgi:hypothetical protein
MIDAPTIAPDELALQSDADFLDALLAFAGHAPAWTPSLPWSVCRDGATLQLRLHRLRDELLHDPANREVVMACGAVLENMRIAARHLGRDLLVARWPNGVDDTVVATIALGEALEPRHEDDALFRVMTSSGTPASPSPQGRGVSPALLAVLRHAARCEGGWLDVVADDARRELVGDLESEAATIGDAERGARSLLALRLERERAASGAVEVAMSGGTALAPLLTTLGANVRESNAWSADRAAVARGSTVTAPILAILGSSADLPQGWLDAGAALQRVLLHAKVQGLTATFLNEPLHHPLLRDALRTVLFAGGAPQAIVRFDFDDRGQAPGHNGHAWKGRSAA